MKKNTDYPIICVQGTAWVNRRYGNIYIEEDSIGCNICLRKWRCTNRELLKLKNWYLGVGKVYRRFNSGRNHIFF